MSADLGGPKSPEGGPRLSSKGNYQLRMIWKVQPHSPKKKFHGKKT